MKGILHIVSGSISLSRRVQGHYILFQKGCQYPFEQILQKFAWILRKNWSHIVLGWHNMLRGKFPLRGRYVLAERATNLTIPFLSFMIKVCILEVRWETANGRHAPKAARAIGLFFQTPSRITGQAARVSCLRFVLKRTSQGLKLNAR